MSASKPIVTFEEPPVESRKRPDVIQWEEVIALLKKHPNTWVRLEHSYATPGSARSSVQRAAKVHGLEYRVTTRSPQEDGRPGVFVRYEEKKGDPYA